MADTQTNVTPVSQINNITAEAEKVEGSLELSNALKEASSGFVDQTNSLKTKLDSLIEAANKFSTDLSKTTADVMSKLAEQGDIVQSQLSGINTPDLSKLVGTNSWGNSIKQLSSFLQDMSSLPIIGNWFNNKTGNLFTTGIDPKNKNLTPIEKDAISWLHHAKFGNSVLGSGISNAIGLGKLAKIHPALTAALTALQLSNVLKKQLILVLKENKDALLGGNSIDARTASASAGNWRFGGLKEFGAADYSLYRSTMRLHGLRDDGQIAKSLADMALAGIWGQNGGDAFSAAVSRHDVNRMFGLNMSASSMYNMYRATAGIGENNDGLFRLHAGSFGIGAYAGSLADIVKQSRNAYGVQMGLSDLSSIVEKLTANLQGMNNDMPKLLNNMAKWSKAIANGVLSGEELFSLFKSTNENMSFSSRLNVLALSGQGGDLLSESWKMVERSRNAGGKVDNTRFVAQAALDIFKNQFGGNKAIFSEYGLSMLGLDNLKNNPNFVEILKEAAKGDATALETLNTALKDDHSLLANQVSLLDAIKKPVEHMRDAIFASTTKTAQDILSEGRKKSIEYEYAFVKPDENLSSADIESATNIAIQQSIRDEMDVASTKLANILLSWKEGFTDGTSHNAAIHKELVSIHKLLQHSGSIGE